MSKTKMLAVLFIGMLSSCQPLTGKLAILDPQRNLDRVRFFDITNPGDSVPPASGTLRWAVEQANDYSQQKAVSDSKGFSILRFKLEDRGDIQLLDEIVVSGAMALSLPISTLPLQVIKGTRQNRIFRVTESGELTLSRLSLSEGQATEGGCLLNNGVVQLHEIVMQSCKAKDLGIPRTGFGGAISNHGTLVIAKSDFMHNIAQSGGAIDNSGRVRINLTKFSSNQAKDYGGAINNRRKSIPINGISVNPLPIDWDSNAGAAFGIIVFESQVSINGNVAEFGSGINNEGWIGFTGKNNSITDNLNPANRLPNPLQEELSIRNRGAINFYENKNYTRIEPEISNAKIGKEYPK